MKVILPVVVLLLFLTPAFAQDEDEFVTAAVPALTPVLANSTLRARVFYEQSGRPVRRTNVILVSPKSGPTEASGLTDAEGNLVIKDLKAGRYYPIVNAPGAISPLAYVDFRNRRDEEMESVFAGFPAIVVNGISDVDAVIPVRMGGAISGRISYADGGPAIGVKVEILRKVDDEYLPTLPNFSVLREAMMGGAGTFRTDDRGHYRFTGLPPGEYIVKVSEEIHHPTNADRANRYGFDSMLFGSASLLTLYFENAIDPDNAQKLKVELGQEHAETNIVIPERPLHTLAGKIVAAKNKLPIRNARVAISLKGDTAIPVPAAGRSGHVTYTDENGNWKFVELPKGTYKIVAQAVSSDFDEAEKAYGSKRSAANYASNAANAVSNAAYAVSNTNYGNSNRASAKPPAPKFADKMQEFVIDEKDLTEQTIELTHGASISGSVVTDDGEGIPDAVLIAASDREGETSQTTSVHHYSYMDEGAKRPKSKDFLIEAVTPGTTFVTVHGMDDEFYVKSITFGGTDLLKGSVTLKEGESLANVKIVVARDTGTLEGTVVNADKQPVAGMELSFVPTDPSKLKVSTFYRTRRSGADGEVKVRLAPIEYAVVVFPKAVAKKRTADFHNWLAEAVKKAPVFKIEAGKTVKVIIPAGGAKSD